MSAIKACISKTSTPTLVVLVLVVLATAVVAASVILSNTVVITSTVPDDAATVSVIDVETAGLGDELEHEALPAAPVKGIAYDIGIRLQGHTDVSNAVIVIEISMTGISSGDVSVQWYDAGAAEWSTVTFTDEGDTLSAEISPIGGYVLSSSFDETVPLLITFSAAGSFSTSIWAETI